ncbi:MAG TPA: YidC/Oxa1 family membrane protein insertase [Patescibacteria group bacterium]|nr:YidC/Oxa1 family membrane protein insertase [Patescibacteria group bacterium]
MFTTIFYQPIFNALVFLYNTVPDIGIAIILLTVIIKLALWTLNKKALESQKNLSQLQPKIEALKVQYKDDRKLLAEKTMELYKAENINPASSCLPLLIQLPFLWAVFKVFQDGLSNRSLALVYSFIQKPESINPMAFYGFMDLSKPSIPLAIAAGAAQFFATKMLVHTRQPKISTAKDESMATMINKQMMYTMPILTVVIGFTLPGGLSLYWFVTTLLTIAQQYFVLKDIQKKSL